MPGTYSHTTRADGSILTASIYNSDHQNHITFNTPGGCDDFSTNVSQMQSMVDPGEVGTESLPTDLAGELQRIRKIITELSGRLYWYESPVYLTTIASAATPDIFQAQVGQVVDYTGTATCTGFVAAPKAGLIRTLVCAGAAVFTAGANMLIDGVTSGNSFTAATGDKIHVIAVTTTQFRLTIAKYDGSLVSVGFSAGDAKLTWKTVADNGWVMAEDKSIGDATSGATGRANADTEALYTILWNNVADTYAPVSSGRGASAAADYAAHKTLTIPKTLGRALAGAGTGTVVESGVDGDVDITANDLTVASNNTKWITGMPVVFTLASGTITGLTSGNTYYVIWSSATKVQLASSLANAQNGTAIDFTAKSSPVWTLTHTYTARAMGEAVGEGAHAQSSTELYAHTHSVSADAVKEAGGTVASGTGPSNWTNWSVTNSTGGNAAMNIMQPTTFMNVMVKL